jgi:hypothetical protein
MRIVMAVLLGLIATSAQAEWVKVAQSGETTYYIDPTTLQKDGGLRKIWEIQDFAAARAGGVRSRGALFEFDCGAERWRVLSVADHAEPMAAGKVVGSWEGQSDWASLAPRTGSNIPPDATGRMILRYVCSL